MLDYPDPLEALAMCHDVAAELELDPALVEAIHAHLLAMDGRPPTRELLAAYVTGLVARIDEETLRERLQLPPIGSEPRVVPAGLSRAQETSRQHHRGPGRPGWTAEEFWARWRDACSRSTPPFTPRSVARQFDTLDGNRGTDPDYVRKLVRRYGLPPRD